MGRGLLLLYRERRLRKYLWLPLVRSLILFLAIQVLGFLLLLPVANGIAHSLRVPFLGTLAAVVVFAAFWWYFAFSTYLLLSGIVSSWLWEPLSYEVEKLVRDSPPRQRVSLFKDAPLRLAFTVLICLLSVVAACLFVAPTWLLAGWLGLYDYTAPAFLRRGVPFRRQFGFAPKCKGSLGFALTAGLFTLIPVLNVLMLPALVAGGTLMVAESNPTPIL